MDQWCTDTGSYLSIKEGTVLFRHTEKENWIYSIDNTLHSVLSILKET